MILEVLYNHPLNIGAIVTCVIGILIGVGLLVGTLIQKRSKKIKSGWYAIFLSLSIAIVAVGLYSLVKALS